MIINGGKMEENVISAPGAALKEKLRHKEGQFKVSVKDIFRYLKKLCAVWLAVSVVVSLVVVSVTAVVKQDSYRKLTSLISFTYDGVEKGLDPNGNKFYVNTIKSEEIIREVLAEMNIPEDRCDVIRRNITFEGVIPEDAIKRITTYNNVFKSAGDVSSSIKVSDSTYYPTQYRVHFDYASTELSDTEAAEFINKMLDCYSQHFFDAYGFNKSLGNTLNAFDYHVYDYSEVIDVFDSTLSKLSTYITQVSSTDTTRFRSKETGYTFSDITEAIDTLRKIDLSTIDSYVTINSVTKDKETLLTYYLYRTEELQRKLSVYNDTLASVNDSIASYRKDKVMYFGDGKEKEGGITASLTSKEYDDLFKKRQQIQDDLSTTVQQINLYNKRIERLNASTQANSTSKKAKVEEEIAALNDNINDIIDAAGRTTDDYYRTIVFPKAYNVLTPASASTFGVIKHAVKDSLFSVLIIDAVILVIYIASALILAVRREIVFLYGPEAVKKAKKEKHTKHSKSEKESK